MKKETYLCDRCGKDVKSSKNEIRSIILKNNYFISGFERNRIKNASSSIGMSLKNDYKIYDIIERNDLKEYEIDLCNDCFNELKRYLFGFEVSEVKAGIEPVIEGSFLKRDYDYQKGLGND